MPRKRISTTLAIMVAVSIPAFSQTPEPAKKTLERRGPETVQPATTQAVPPQAMPAPAATAESKLAPAAKPATPKEAPTDYILGAEDQISLWTPEAEELNGKALRVEGNGSLTLPLVGTLKAAGLTANQLAVEISKRLEKYYLKPQVVVSVTEYRSQPVSVIGAVNTPGVHQVQGRKTLVEMLSLAGGTRQDAGSKIIITRRAEWGMIPVEGAVMDASGEFSTAEIDLSAAVTAQRPQDNIAVKPNDIIAVTKARLVYVVGEVNRPAGYVLERKGLSVAQALAMAGGLKSTAAGKDAAIIHKDEAGPKERTRVNLGEVLAGKAADIEMEPDDILFVPDSKPKKAVFRAAEAAIQMATGIAIWRAGNPI
jgi:polysaccharide export outer membrane protein